MKGGTTLIPEIKFVMPAERLRESDITFTTAITDTLMLFDLNEPDIKITYNSDFRDEMSFALSYPDSDKYDFVSIVIRDVIKAMGFMSAYRKHPRNEQLIAPSRKNTYFEDAIANVIGNDPYEMYQNATRGNLEIGILNLYAPETWEDGVSLNYTIKDHNSGLNDLLSYELDKGSVRRNVNEIDRIPNLLNWYVNFATSGSTPQSSTNGSSNNFMPYNGSVILNYPMTTGQAEAGEADAMNSEDDYDDEDWDYKDAVSTFVNNYLNKHHVYLTPDLNPKKMGTSISVMKKDGSWDLVRYMNGATDVHYIPMSMLEFHYTDDEYYRTIDGHLRARLTTAIYIGRWEYSTTYFVIGALPQKVETQFVKMESSKTTRVNSREYPVRVYFKNTEGVTTLELEMKRKGGRGSAYIAIDDIKKGFIDFGVDRAFTYTFTPISYNENGETRGEPVVIEAIRDTDETSELAFSQESDYITVENIAENEIVNYILCPINATLSIGTQTGVLSAGDCRIETGNLPGGYYILKCTEESGVSKEYKFAK